MGKPGLAAVIVSMVIAVSGCGGSDDSADSSDRAAPPTWDEIAPSLTPGVDPDSDNVCTAGAVECVDALIAEMDRRLERLVQSCDHNLPFAFAYVGISRALREVGQHGYFDDVAYINHLDAIFASFYFSAVDAWTSGSTSDVPRAWQVAFDAADRHQVNSTGDLVLGINAHIIRDLSFVLADIGLTAPDGSSRKADFDRFNDIFPLVLGPTLDEGSRRFDPLFDDVDIPQLNLDNASFLEVIRLWRDQAWTNAEALTVATSPADRARVAETIEGAALGQALATVAATSYLPLLGGASDRAAFCEEHRHDE